MDNTCFMNNEGQYGKYIMQDLCLPAIHATPEAVAGYEKLGRKRIHWLDDNNMPGCFQINTSWYYQANHDEIDRQVVEAGEKGTMGKSHVHEVDELLCFYGSNPYDPYDLGGEVEIYIEGEKHLLTKSSLIFLPAGISHLPLYVNRVDRPIFHFSLLLASNYDFTCENGETFSTK